MRSFGFLAFCTTVLFGLTSGHTLADSASAPAASSTDLSAFVGARSVQAEPNLEELGFERIRSSDVTEYWLNRASGACAKIETNEGRYTSIKMLPAQEC